jgi:hypothetical protein
MRFYLIFEKESDLESTSHLMQVARKTSFTAEWIGKRSGAQTLVWFALLCHFGLQ